jgi:hypothetical protein
MPKEHARNILKVGWRIAVCALLLGWIFQAIFYNEGHIAWDAAHPGKDWAALTKQERFVAAWTFGPPGLWATLKLMDPRFLGLSVCLMGALLFVGVIRWQSVLKVYGLGLPLSRTTEISAIAHFFNSFLLGSVGGDLLKAYYVARETHHKKTEAVVTVLVDRISGLFSMLLLACVMMLFNFELLATLNAKLKLVIWLILAMTGACAVFIFLSFWGGVSKGIPGARDWLRRLPKGQTLERSLEAFREFGRHGTAFLRVLGISMIGNLFCVLQLVALIWGFHHSVPIGPVAAVILIVTCISTLPITPSGLGVRENLYVWFLTVKMIGLPYADALLISLVGYATSLFWSAVGGFVYLTVKEKEHLAEIETAEPDASLL